MHMTRPYFRGYSVLSNIVDKSNTIENIRAKNEEKTKNKYSKNIQENMYCVGTIKLSKNIVDTFYINNDIVEIIKMKNKMAKNILDFDAFIEELINNKEYTTSLANMLKIIINRHIDSNLYIDVSKLSTSFLYSSYIRAYKNVYNDFLDREIKMRRKVN